MEQNIASYLLEKQSTKSSWCEYLVLFDSEFTVMTTKEIPDTIRVGG